jgi:hypothetical protein
MRVVVAIGVLMLMQTATARAQRPCNVDGPPFGPTGYVGNSGYKFDYWSHAGTVNGDNFYQVGIKNLGPTPLTIDWQDAGYFRRGIAAGREAPGSCNRDRNWLNTAAGRIKYGPNAQFDGPIATFFTRSDALAMQSSEPIQFLVEWESILDAGENYLASVSVETTRSGPSSIRYTFINVGRPVELEWPGVLTETALAVVRRQNDSLVRGSRLVLRTSEPAQFTVADDGRHVRTITASLAIFVPNGLLLYRDNHRALALVRQ